MALFPRRVSWAVLDRLVRVDFVLVLLALALVVGYAMGAVAHRFPPTALHPSLSPVGTAYIPPGRLFGLPGSPGVVPSAYAYEANLVPSPAADSDYLLPQGATDRVYLPGGAWDRYALIQVTWIQGSGWCLEWEVLNGPDAGARFAYLHLSLVYVAGPTLLYRGHPPTGAGLRANDDPTGLALLLARPATGHPVRATLHHGGELVGRSGWPLDPAYGNGVAGPGNAQLCVVYDLAAAAWWYRLAFGFDHPPVPPPVFPAAAWNAWRHAHHRAALPYQVHGRLTPVARSWWHGHQRCGGVQAPAVWFARPHYERQQFVRCWAYSWPRDRGDPVQWQRRAA